MKLITSPPILNSFNVSLITSFLASSHAGWESFPEDDLLKIKYFAIDGEDTIKYDDVLSYNNSVNVNS